MFEIVYWHALKFLLISVSMVGVRRGGSKVNKTMKCRYIPITCV